VQQKAAEKYLSVFSVFQLEKMSFQTIKMLSIPFKRQQKDQNNPKNTTICLRGNIIPIESLEEHALSGGNLREFFGLFL
jgi:hypothetical protein